MNWNGLTHQLVVHQHQLNRMIQIIIEFSNSFDYLLTGSVVVVSFVLVGFTYYIYTGI